MSGSLKKFGKRRRPSASLLTSESLGGITAGGGFDFQTRYATCHLPLWLKEQLHQLLFEGTGDIDVRFSNENTSSRIHIQVKDHEVAPGELKSVIEHFLQIDSGMAGVYKQFTLACPSLSATLRQVETALARLRGAKPFYDDAPDALAPTKEDLEKRLRKAGVGGHIEFILSKVFIQVGHGDLRHDDRAVELFIARLLSLPTYAGKLRAMVQPAFSELMRTIAAHKGVVLERSKIEAILQAAILKGDAEEKAITIWIQNWTSESFDLAADYALDWSSRFDRSSRRVPSADMWNNELLPSLSDLKKEIAANGTERLIRFRGKCALSTGVALGAIFPAVGGWIFEIPQPPSTVAWRSDAPPTSPYDLHVETIDGDPDGKDLVIGLNIRGDGRKDIAEYIEGTGTFPKLFAFMSPSSQGAQAIKGSDDACAFARAVRDHLGQLLKQHRLGHTHLFFYGPFALAVFLGQQLTSVGEVQLYEYQDPGYVESCRLWT